MKDLGTDKLRSGKSCTKLIDHKKSMQRAHQLLAQYQMVSPENIHTSNIIWAEQVIFRDICVYTTTLSEKEAKILKKNMEGYKETSGGRKGKGEMLSPTKMKTILSSGCMPASWRWKERVSYKTLREPEVHNSE